MEYKEILSVKNQNLKDLALSLKKKYSSADPFPHIQIDNFFSDKYLDEVLRQFPDLSNLTKSFFKAINIYKFKTFV